MRIGPSIIVTIGSLVLLSGAGCATRHDAAAVDPHPEELPKIQTRRNRTIPARIAVAGRQTARAPLVGEIPKPTITPEERAILGEDAPEITFLEYEIHRLSPNSTVAPWYGGVDARGYRGTGVNAARSNLLFAQFGVGGWAGVTVAADSFGASVGQRATTDRRAAGMTGQREGIRVETSAFESRIADKQSRVEN